MDVNLSPSTKYIGLGTELSSSSDCEYLDSDCIDIIEFLICEVYNNLVEAIILSSL